MKYVKLTNGIVEHTWYEPRNGYIEAPDNVQCGWQLNGQTWEKGATLTAQELKRTQADAAGSQVRQAVADMKAGVGTAGERIARVEKGLAWIIESVIQSSPSGGAQTLNPK